MPNYEVEFVYCPVVVVIGAKDEEQAIEFAQDEMPMTMTECLMDTKVRKLKRGRETDAAVREADEVSRPTA
jgi:acyl-CoA reductase-like NAD-dependent aldehyde dehydrogenase